MKYSLLNHSLRFDSSGNCRPSTLVLEAIGSNDPAIILAFDDAVTGSVWGSFEVPESWAAKSVALGIVWTQNAASGTVDWNFRYDVITGDNTESADISVLAFDDEIVSVVAASPTVAKYRRVASVALTASNFAANTTIYWWFFRDGGDAANDTSAVRAAVFSLYLDVT